MNDLTHLSLFTGVGGIDLAAEWAGFRTVGQVERDGYARKILKKHWPGVPRWEDILWFYATDFRGRTGLDRPTLITGGFPCQPFSVAGNRKGTSDDRYLWPEMFRVVQELRPDWVVGENVAGIFNLALDDVLADLEDTEYTARAFSIPACAVGAPHERQRIFIVAHTISERSQVPRKAGLGCQENSRGPPSPPERICGWDVEPGMGRVADGVPDRVDRLRCLGNAVVPQQIYPILKAIAEIERGDLG